MKQNTDLLGGISASTLNKNERITLWENFLTNSPLDFSMRMYLYLKVLGYSFGNLANYFDNVPLSEDVKRPDLIFCINLVKNNLWYKIDEWTENEFSALDQLNDKMFLQVLKTQNVVTDKDNAVGNGFVNLSDEMEFNILKSRRDW